MSELEIEKIDPHNDLWCACDLVRLMAGATADGCLVLERTDAHHIIYGIAETIKMDTAELIHKLADEFRAVGQDVLVEQ